MERFTNLLDTKTQVRKTTTSKNNNKWGNEQDPRTQQIVNDPRTKQNKTNEKRNNQGKQLLTIATAEESNKKRGKQLAMEASTDKNYKLGTTITEKIKTNQQ